MNIKVPVVSEKVVEVICNKCEATCTSYDQVHNYVSLQAHFGYGSSLDGYQIDEMHLCEKCFLELESMFKIKPVKKCPSYYEWGQASEDL